MTVVINGTTYIGIGNWDVLVWVMKHRPDLINKL